MRTANHRIYIVILSLGLCVVSIFLVRACFSSRQIAASVYPLEVELKTPVCFSDSTKNAGNWMWEFGNGDVSTEQSGHYFYRTEGKYQIRLIVDGKLEKKFIVNVKTKSSEDNLEQLINIIAPNSGLQGEYITFRGEGSSKEWRWEFGETGQTDSREKTAIYKYNEPGTYDVLLSTEETYYPIRHTIVIEPKYMDKDTLTVETMIGNDIREKLQAIVEQKPFNKNYNYILNTYLCGNPNTPIMVNNTKKNDFYSYCQGLKIVGNKRTNIEKVLIDMDEENTYCIIKLIVIQEELGIEN